MSSDANTNCPAIPPADRPMSPGQRLIATIILLAIVALGITTEQRSAFLKRRMTDLGPYVRAAWAIRVGADPFAVTDPNGWHYCYPQLMAIALAPMAEAPPGGEPVAALPWVVSVGVWYLLGVICTLLAVHFCASAFEFGMSSPPQRWGYRWWANRLGPLIIVLPMAGRTVARGQVNTIVLVFLAGWIVSVVRGRRMTGGFCLAMAICIKIIPAFLLIHPIWRRDRRCLAGAAWGMLIGLVAAPILASGPVAAAEQTRSLVKGVLLPGIGAGHDRTRAEELTDAMSTDSQSIQSVLHIVTHRTPQTWSRTVEPWNRAAHWSIAAILTLTTLVIGSRGSWTPQRELAFTGALCIVMAVTSPVCHLHYFVFALPAATFLWCGPRGWFVSAAVITFIAIHTLSLFSLHFGMPWHIPLRQFGFTTATALSLWAVALAKLTVRSSTGSTLTHASPVARAA